MERIAIISDVHANITALEAVLKDIDSRKVDKIFCIGDSIVKGANPAKVIDILREKCDVMLIGNTDYTVCTPEAKEKGYWTAKQIGEERAKFIFNLPRMHQFYLSGQLVRLFHATPYDLDGIYNPMYKNKDSAKEITNPDEMFKNTRFLGVENDIKEPDIVGYGHIHTPLLVKYKNRTIFNTGSIGVPVEMQIIDENDENNKFSTVASYTILEGEYESKEYSNIAFTQVRVIYDIDKEIEILKASDMPSKDEIIRTLKSAKSEKGV